jgi:hypothetical protein
MQRQAAPWEAAGVSARRQLNALRSRAPTSTHPTAIGARSARGACSACSAHPCRHARHQLQRRAARRRLRLRLRLRPHLAPQRFLPHCSVQSLLN